MRVLTVIVGGRFHPGAMDRIAKLEEGEQVLLLREPENPFDRNAVAVKSTDGVMLGHVPRADAPLIARALDEFYGPEAYVARPLGYRAAAPSLVITWEN